MAETYIAEAPWEQEPFIAYKNNIAKPPVVDVVQNSIKLPSTEVVQKKDNGLFGSNSYQDMFGYAKGVSDIFGSLYGMYNQHKALGLARDTLNMQKQAYYDNRTARNNFVNATRQAFGSPNQL